jgi:hypothetical protein
VDTKWLAEGNISAPGSVTLDEVNREIQIGSSNYEY